MAQVNLRTFDAARLAALIGAKKLVADNPLVLAVLARWPGAEIVRVDGPCDGREP